MKVSIRHWLPILTYCPVNKLPDLIYVTVHVNVAEQQRAPELYRVRRAVRAWATGKLMFMEDIAVHIQRKLMSDMGVYASVEVRLAFSRHVVYYGSTE